jgi:hypothetical protein
LNSVQHVFEITGTLDDSTSIYNFEEKIKPVIHSGIKNKLAAFTIFNFAPCILSNLLYLKPNHALLLKHTFTFTFIKTLELVKNVF